MIASLSHFLWAALLALAGLVTGFVLLTYLFCLWDRRYDYLQRRFREMAAGPTGAPPPYEPSPQTPFILKIIVLEILATLWAVMLSIGLFWKKWNSEMAVWHTPKRPILLVHGFFHNQTGWSYIRRRLTEAGLGPVYSLNLGGPFEKLETFAERVARKAARIEAETGIKELVMIGHSMGGLVSAYYAEHLAPEGKVTDVIALGSPLQGTKLGAMGHGVNSIQMTTGSNFTRALAARIAASQSTRYYQIASELDNMILPARAAFVGENGERQRMLDDHGHVMLIFSRRVADQIAAWLTPVYAAIQPGMEEADAPAGQETRHP